MEVPQKQKYLWKNTKELIHSWNTIHLKHVYFKTKVIKNICRSHSKKQVVPETQTVNLVAEYSTRTRKMRRAHACLESRDSPE